MYVCVPVSFINKNKTITIESCLCSLAIKRVYSLYMYHRCLSNYTAAMKYTWNLIYKESVNNAAALHFIRSAKTTQYESLFNQRCESVSVSIVSHILRLCVRKFFRRMRAHIIGQNFAFELCVSLPNEQSQCKFPVV